MSKMFSTNISGGKSLKDKNVKTVLNAFIEIVNESNRKPNKLWADQGREFYSKLMQEWLDNNYILMYSTHNEDKKESLKCLKKHQKLKSIKKWQLMMASLIFLIWINY